MKLLCVLLAIVGLCCLGALAARLGLRRLDDWCARQLTDTNCAPEGEGL